MSLSRVERERLNDSRMRIQSVVSTLEGVDPRKIPHFQDIDSCLKEAEESLRIALRDEHNASKLP